MNYSVTMRTRIRAGLALPRPSWRLPLLFVLLAGLPLWAGEKPKGEHGEKKESEHNEKIPVTIQAAQASEQGKNTDKPELDAALQPYANVLKNQGFGKYKDAGKDSGSAPPNGTMTLKVGDYTVEVTVQRGNVRKKVALNYVIKKDGKEIAKAPIVLTPDQATPVQFGAATNPTILLFKLGK